MTFEASHELMHVFTIDAVLRTSMDTIIYHLPRHASIAYVFFLCSYSHRCARHLDPTDVVQVLDVPWQVVLGLGGGGGVGSVG